MLTDICEDTRNWFSGDADKQFGKFTIEGGKFTPLFAQEGQYYRIVGSVFNDGVHKVGDTDLIDETFDGAVWLMRVPRQVVALAEEIDEFNKNNKPSAYTSESFGGYSYSKATTASGSPATWRQVFAPQLNKWRKI